MSYIFSRTQGTPIQSLLDSTSVDLHHLAQRETSSGRSMTVESMQQLTTTHSLTLTQASISSANSRTFFAGANIGSIPG